MKKSKLNLSSLKVKSFVTAFNISSIQTVKGGLANRLPIDEKNEETRWCSNLCSEPGVGCTR